MPRRREKGVVKERSWRSKKVIWFYRDGHGKRTRLPGEYGSPEFNAALAAAKGYTTGFAAVAVKAAKGLAPSDPNSFAWLVDQYLASTEHLSKRGATQKARKNTLLRIVKRDGGKVGSSDFHDIDADDIQALHDKIVTDDGKIPADKIETEGKIPMANRTVDILRVMFKWAISRGHLKRNPCLGVQGLKDTNAGTNYVWTPADMLRFEALYGPGTRERLAYALLLYSGQRSGDVVRMGRQHIKKDDRGIPWLVTRQQRKTSKGAKVPVVGVLTEAIADADAAGVTGDLTFLVGDDGLTMTEFSRWFKRACKKAGVPECSAHGLRHAGATRLASRGARPSTLIQIYGFTLTQADNYIRDAEMEKTTLEDIHLLNHVA